MTVVCWSGASGQNTAYQHKQLVPLVKQGGGGGVATGPEHLTVTESVTL